MQKISIVVPIYNVERYINRCIDSILNQTLSDFELILVDDGSPDSCGKICDDYKKRDKRVTVIHQENAGLSAARNAGIDWAIKNSNSDLITFIDSDDWIHPQMLEFLFIGIQQTGLDICMCDVLKTEISEKITENIIKNYHFVTVDTETAYVENHTSSTVAFAKLYRKKCFSEIRYPVGKIHEDEFTTYKILFKQPKIAYINLPLYFYYQRSGSIMHADWSPKRLVIFDAYKQQLQFFKNNSFINAYKRQLKSYIWLLCEHISLIKKTNNKDYFQYQKNLEKRLRQFIRQHKKELGLTLKNDSYLYESAYPKFIQLYWIISSKFKKE